MYQIASRVLRCTECILVLRLPSSSAHPAIRSITNASQHLLTLPPSAGHAGTVVGILAPGPSAAPFVSAPEVSDAMAVDPSPSTSTTTPSTSTTPAVSAATKKKEEEAKAEREKKYPSSEARAGIVLAAEKKVTSKLLEKEKGSSEKLFLVNG